MTTLLSDYFKEMGVRIVDIRIVNDISPGSICWVLPTAIVIGISDMEEISITKIYPKRTGSYQDLFQVINKHPIDLRISLDCGFADAPILYDSIILDDKEVEFEFGLRDYS